MATKLEFDTPDAAPAGGGRKLEFDEAPKSIGRAAQDLPREMELRGKYGQEIAQRGEPGYGERFIDSATMGLTRPLSGAVRAVGGLFDPNTTAGERYRAGVGAAEDYFKQGERNTPGALGVATDVAGAFAAPPVGKIATAGRAVEAGGRALLGRLVAQGATQGAIEGAARNAEDAGSATTGAVTGGLVGGGTSAAVGKAAKFIPGMKGAEAEVRKASREGGSEALKEAGGEVYTALDKAGIKFKDATPLVQDTIDKMQAKGFNYAAGVHGDLVPVAERIGKLNGKEVTWKELQQIREQLSAVKASDNKQARRMAGHLADTLDEFVNTAKPTVPINKLGTVNPGDFAKAQDLWRRGSQAENAEWLTKKGMATSPNPGRKLETNFGGELDKINNPNRFSTHQGSPEQAAQIETIARGDPNRAKLAEFFRQQSGKLVGLGALGTSAGAGGMYAGDTTGVGSGVGAGGIATLVAGLAGKGGAGALRRGIARRGGERVNDLIRNIVTGSAKETEASTANAPRAALAKLMAVEQAKRGASRYAAGKVTEKE